MLLEIRLVGELEDASLKNALEEAIHYVQWSPDVLKLEGVLRKAQLLFEDRLEYIIDDSKIAPDEDLIYLIAFENGVPEENLNIETIQDMVEGQLWYNVGEDIGCYRFVEQGIDNINWSEENTGIYKPSHDCDIFEGEYPQIYIHFDVVEFEKWYKENKDFYHLLLEARMFPKDIISLVVANEEYEIERYEEILNFVEYWYCTEQTIRAICEAYEEELFEIESIISEKVNCYKHYPRY